MASSEPLRYYVYEARSGRYFYDREPHTRALGARGPLYAIRLKHWAPIKAEEHKKDE